MWFATKWRNRMDKPNAILHIKECETLKELLRNELEALRRNKSLMAHHEDTVLKLYYEELIKFDLSIGHDRWDMQDRMECLHQEEVDAIRTRRDKLQPIIAEGKKNRTFSADYEIHKWRIEILERLLSDRFELKAIVKNGELDFIPISK
jgi:hypothetical protein